MAETTAQFGEVGETVAGRYAVEQLLGRGGMSAVYRVRDLRTGQKLALKRGFSTGSRNARRRQEMLEREFNTLSQLAHPCIIEVYDYGVDDQSCAYYTMELLDGADLHNSGVLPWQRVCSLLRDVTSCLSILHSRGLLHRDVTARNVRCTADGRAKLIDFGAMSSIGVPQDVVGTPPFLAPEVMQMQSLDGRADLFSVGALAYYLLTGRHAYPARRLHDLRDVWRSPPAPPIRFQPEIPPALSALIMQLLSLDRSTRAHSAPEVMTRLCTIAGLPLAEQAQVSRAYLTTPTLVGRERELIGVRKSMLSLARGDGGTLLVQGVAGSGRSRMLDACAVEAKLVGAHVIRTDAHGERGDWDVARALGSQLLRFMPEQAQEAARLSRELLAPLLDGLRDESQGHSSGVPIDRNQFIRAFRDFVLTLARQQRLVIVVDDADCIDEPSAAVLAALAHKTERHPLILALSVDREEQTAGSAWLRLLHLVAVTIELPQLNLEQTEALVASVFGAARNLPLIAAKTFALSQGNPRAIMEVAQHLVDRGLARYEAGSWQLPDDLSERDLPASLAASLAERVERLSGDARELVETLCLADADGEALSFEACVALGSHSDAKRVFRAFDELVAARVLVASASHHHFSQRGFLTVIEQAMTPERRQHLHSGLSDRLAASGGDLLRRADHLLAAGRDLAAIELLTSVDHTQRSPPLDLLERAIGCALQLGAPARTVYLLRRALLIKATTSMAFESYLRHCPFVFAQLAKDSGYDAYMALAGLPPAERLTQALTSADAAYRALPEREQVHGVVDAIREFALAALTARAMGTMMMDAEFIAALPSLEPFATLSPALHLAALTGDATLEWLRGRFSHAHENFTQVLMRLDEPDRAQLFETEHQRMQLSIHYGLGVLKASRGIATAEAHAETLERGREFRVNAWRVRRIWHLSQGNVEEAKKCQRRAELLQLQDGSEQNYGGSSILSELGLFALIGDVLELKNALDVINSFTERLPGWRPFRAFGQAISQHVQGDSAGALEKVVSGLQEAPAGRHPAYGFLAGLHVEVLCELGRVAQARELGLHYVEVSEREEITTTGQVVYLATARALALNGEYERANRLLDGVIEVAQTRQQTGVSIGAMYEARARLALESNDRTGFERFAELCAREYRKGDSPFLAAKCARLLEEARGSEHGPLPEAMPLIEAATAVNTEYLTIQSRLLECVDEQDRARTALTMLLQDLESFTGYLIGVNGATPILLAALPEEEESEVGADLLRWMRAYLQAELAGGNPGDQAAEQSRSRFVARDGRRFEPLLLMKDHADQQLLAAVLIRHVAPGAVWRSPNRLLLQQIAGQLLEHRDVTGASLPEPSYTQTQRK